jgi:hypothetical protein
VVFAVGLGLTSGSLALLHALTVPATALELAVLVIANLVATGVRFLLMRSWVFREAHKPAHESNMNATPATV